MQSWNNNVNKNTLQIISASSIHPIGVKIYKTATLKYCLLNMQIVDPEGISTVKEVVLPQDWYGHKLVKYKFGCAGYVHV